MDVEAAIKELRERICALEQISCDSSKTREDAIKILDFLNEKTGKKYKPSKSSLQYIEARIREGYSTKDLSKVISVKLQDEFFTDNNYKFMRPSTLFNSKNFVNYLEEVHAYEKTIQKS